MKTLNFLASVLFVSIAAMTPVHADGVHGDAKSLTVQFADLDLSKPEGAITLFGRIKGAARSVCSSLNGRTIRQKQEYAACVDFALSNTVARVDRPVLTEYFASKSSKEKPVKVASGR
jgi:UrcA family protein